MCEYCNIVEPINIVPYDIKEKIGVRVNRANARLIAFNDTKHIAVKINFCPMCGKKLEQQEIAP